MRIAVINPNTTASMTERIAQAARRVASPATEIIGRQPATGPAAIEGPFDGALSVPRLLKEIVAAEADGVDAHIIACFDDTGLDAARAVARKPVIGIGEASFHAVSLVAHSFAVVTTLSRSAPVIEDNINRYGFGRRCRKVFATDIPVLELENPASGAVEMISAMIVKAKDMGVEGISLGCAGMADFAQGLQREHAIPVVDGVSAAVGLAEMLVRCGLSTSKSGIWAPPTRMHVLGSD
ncbi:aspartate/glutamate racemase family protein [Rhizobium sp. SSA_523]|uniref:aspartate/glutamate racemase family protein n=1 Tax=Rhizobium sp. SSA_523 TaxID=2952477 RepID=UPI002091C216|nr:aspartate/glutamate racemase family protein [Rhizobium sp. SSA_523]MCO5733341.1 aspartate/glutamate racemase family protein [Rhizobium sp. SSA_523]WKC22546.1 aspartate/glutamate racemase family protein [Rhizobium sp. SSA_523]